MIKKKFELFESKFELELEKPSLWKFKSYFEKINIKTVKKINELGKNLIDKEYAFIMKEKNLNKELLSLSVMKILTILSSNIKDNQKDKNYSKKH